MAKKLYEEDNIMNIANAIRKKTGKSDSMHVSDMATEIESIELFDIKGLVTGDIAKKIVIPNGIKSIRNHCFDGCKNLEIEFQQPCVVSTIGESSFDTCAGITLTELPESITIIDNKAFCYCLRLALTSLPPELVTIGDSAFYSCTGLEISVIPASITTIGDSAFTNCTNITTLTFKGTPESIANNAFSGCNSLTTINVPWADGAVPNAPWGAATASINYNYVETEV